MSVRIAAASSEPIQQPPLKPGDVALKAARDAVTPAAGENSGGEDASAVKLDITNAVRDQNIAAAGSEPADIEAASRLVDAIRSQMGGAPQAALAAHGQLSPKTVLSLLS